MSEMHRDRRDELASYLLGALEPGEMAGLEQHLAGCQRCREELQRLRPAVQALPDSVERREAPPQLRDRVMAEVRADVVRSRAARRAWASIPLRPAAGLAAILLVAVAIVGYATRDGGAGSGTSVVVAGKSPGVTARMVRDGDAGTLRLANLRELPSSEALQAWVQRGKRVERAGPLFARHRDGTAITAIDDMSGVSTVMVTAEPRGGSAFPTSKPLISVRVNQ